MHQRKLREINNRQHKQGKTGVSVKPSVRIKEAATSQVTHATFECFHSGHRLGGRHGEGLLTRSGNWKGGDPLSLHNMFLTDQPILNTCLYNRCWTKTHLGSTALPHCGCIINLWHLLGKKTTNDHLWTHFRVIFRFFLFSSHIPVEQPHDKLPSGTASLAMRGFSFNLCHCVTWHRADMPLLFQLSFSAHCCCFYSPPHLFSFLVLLFVEIGDVSFTWEGAFKPGALHASVSSSLIEKEALKK